MIRMNRKMRDQAEADTDRLVLQVDPADVLGLRALVDTARLGDGAAQVKEHDLLVLVERIRLREGNGNGSAYSNGVDDAHPSWRAYTELEEMG